MKTRVWLSYDLGIDGDWDGLDRFLDECEALECGGNLATFRFEFESEHTLVPELTAAVKKAVDLSKGRPRIYAMYGIHDYDVKGEFIAEHRQPARWLGSATTEIDTVDQ